MRASRARGANSLVSLCINAGVDINQIDKDKNTVLHHAAQKGYFYFVVEYLVAGGCNVNAINKYGHIPLACAMLGRSNDINQYASTTHPNRELIINILKKAGGEIILMDHRRLGIALGIVVGDRGEILFDYNKNINNIHIPKLCVFDVNRFLIP